MTKITGKNIVLTFADKETVDYIQLVCRRKGTTLEDYIIDNFEWDEHLPCIKYKITKGMCESCNFSSKCLDIIN